MAAVCVSAAATVPGTAARAQSSGGVSSTEDLLDLGKIVEAVANLVFNLAENTQEKVFQFLETVELFDFETEIDRMVGNPHELNDSTAYKLSLLPFHIRYPIYQQLVRQMTRQDELRSRRIHMVTPDSVQLIELRLDSLADENVKNEEVRNSLLKHFNGREIVDLGFFILAQQSFFPETEEGWQQLKHTIATKGAILGAGALVLGAAFDVGALGRSGTIKRFADNQLRLGWYASFRRLGFKFRPQFRFGLTLQVPGLEASGGLSQRVRPLDNEPNRALELAIREGWLNRLTQSHGWDAFFEAALRRALSTPADFTGEVTTGRAGFFFKRDYIPGLRNLTLRGSAETESDFSAQLRFAIGLGFEHAPTGLAMVLQASRTPALMGEERVADTRGGIFFAGTSEPPTQMFVESMRAQARLVQDEWEVLLALDRRRETSEQALRLLGTRRLTAAQAQTAMLEVEKMMALREQQLVRLAERVADYLESRRLAYSLSHWSRSASDLHGPLDPVILGRAREQVFAQLQSLSGHLEKVPARFELINRRYALLADSLRRLQQSPRSPTMDGYRQELDLLTKTWRRESEQAGVRLGAYMACRDSAKRILATARATARFRDPDPLRPNVLRRVLVLKELPPR